MNNTLDKCLAERRSAQRLWAANRRAKERKAKEQQEEEALERECLSFPHLYQGPDPDEDKDRRKARHKEIRKNIKDERKILEEERALEDECRSKFPHIPLYRLYEIRPFGENREERKLRRRRIRRRMDSDQFVRAAAPVCHDHSRDNVPTEDGSPNETDGVDARAVRFREHCFSIFPNGAVYWGHFVEGQFDGEGILMYPADDWDDRVMYHGHWKTGQKEGRGKLRWQDGGEYVGDFKNDECHGQGKFTFPSDDQSEFNNVHWNNLQDIFDQQLDLHWAIYYDSLASLG